MTYEEKRAILEYKSSRSYTFNEVLRSGENLNAEQKTFKNNINAAEYPKKEIAKKAVKEYMAKYKNTVLKKQYGKKATKAGK